MVVVGAGYLLRQFRRDACYQDPDDEDTVTLSLGKLFPLRRFRDQYDATRFLNCDKIGKAFVWCKSEENFIPGAMVFCFDADRDPLLRYVRLVSIEFPKLEFILKIRATNRDLDDTVIFIAGKSSDDDCDNDCDEINYWEEEYCIGSDDEGCFNSNDEDESSTSS